jgi:hypothetical protein
VDVSGEEELSGVEEEEDEGDEEGLLAESVEDSADGSAEASPELSEEPEEFEEPDDPLDRSDKPDVMEESDESSATPVSTFPEAASLLSPDVSPQVPQAPTPWSARSFWATEICWLRLARSGREA